MTNQYTNMKDERQSEYIKRVVDFAKYMQKEYIDEDENKCLLISAGDRNVDKQRIIHAIVGNNEMIVANMVSLMQKKEMAEIFRMARIVNNDVDDFTNVISDKRHCLRLLYMFSALSAFWMLVLVAFAAFGVCNWMTTATNLLVMGWVVFHLVRDIRSLRRQISRIESDVVSRNRDGLQSEI